MKKGKAAKGGKGKGKEKDDDLLTVKELRILAAKMGMSMEAIADLVDSGGPLRGSSLNSPNIQNQSEGKQPRSNQKSGNRTYQARGLMRLKKLRRIQKLGMTLVSRWFRRWCQLELNLALLGQLKMRQKRCDHTLKQFGAIALERDYC